MTFKSLGQSNSKELFEYAFIGIFLGAILNMYFRSFVAVIGGGLSILGWICLIWGIIKWSKERKQKVEPEKPKIEMDTKEINYCPKCGAKLLPESKFCPNCGYKIK